VKFITGNRWQSLGKFVINLSCGMQEDKTSVGSPPTAEIEFDSEDDPNKTIRLSWVMRPRHSDAYLLRLRRKIESYRPRDRLPCQKSPSIHFSRTEVERHNMEGSSEISFCFLL
jgi:hypothetical protein